MGRFRETFPRPAFSSARRSLGWAFSRWIVSPGRFLGASFPRFVVSCSMRHFLDRSFLRLTVSPFGNFLRGSFPWRIGFSAGRSLHGAPFRRIVSSVTRFRGPFPPMVVSSAFLGPMYRIVSSWVVSLRRVPGWFPCRVVSSMGSYFGLSSLRRIIFPAGSYIAGSFFSGRLLVARFPRRSVSLGHSLVAACPR